MSDDGERSESAVQSLVRLDARSVGARLWRNNVGVLLDVTGRPVRYGLANDSRKLNSVLKSGDLIGWRTVIVTPDMVGKPIAVFTSRECKPEGWKPRPNDPHERGQRAWAELVNAEGGDAAFATGPGSFNR